MARSTDILSMVAVAPTFVEAHHDALAQTIILANEEYGSEGYDVVSSSCTTSVYNSVEEVPNSVLNRAFGGPATLARHSEVVVVCMTTTLKVYAD